MMLSRIQQLSIKYTRLKCVPNLVSVSNVRLYYWTSKLKFTEKNSVNEMLTEIKSMSMKKELFPAISLDLLFERFSVGEYTSAQSLQLLETCAISGYHSSHSTIMSRVWRILNKRKDLLTPDHYRTMLRYYSISGQPSEAESLFQDLISTGFEPNLVTYQYLVGANARVGNITKIDELLAIMKENDIVINDTTYNYVLLCHLNRGDLNSAISILQKMDKKGIIVNQYAYCALVEYYASQCDVDNIQLILERCKNEMIEHYSWLVLMTIRKLAKSDHQLVIPPFVRFLSGEYGVERAIMSAITLYVQDSLYDQLFEIITTTPKYVPTYSKYLMQEMVYQRISSDQVNAVWNKLNSLGITIENNFPVYKGAIFSESPELITAILNHMHQERIEIHNNAFKKILRLSAQRSDDQLFQTINSLIERFQFRPDCAFLRNIVLPLLDWKADPLETCNKLCATALPTPKCVEAVVSACLHDNDIHAALVLVSKKFFYFNSEETIIRPLIRAYLKTIDTVNFVRFIRIILNSISQFGGRFTKHKLDLEREKCECLVGIVRMIFASGELNNRVKADFLQSLIDHGIFLPKNASNSVIAEENIENPEIISLLEKHSLLNDNSIKNISLVEQHISEKRLDKVLNILAKKTSNDQKHSLDLKTMHKFIDLVIDGLSSRTNKIHINSLYTKIVHNAKSSNADFFKENCIRFIFEPIFTQYRIDQCIMPESLKRSFVKLNNRMNSALIKNSSFAMAVLTFERFIRIYGIVAMIEPLFIALIEHKENNLFQHIHQLNVNERGEQATKIALAYAYIECDMLGRHQIAEDILKTAEQLHVDHLEMYEFILDSHCRQNIKNAIAFAEKCKNNGKFVTTKTFEEMLAKIK